MRSSIARPKAWWMLAAPVVALACGETARPGPPSLVGVTTTGDGGQQQYVPPVHDAGTADTQSPADSGMDAAAPDDGSTEDVAAEEPPPIVCNNVVPMGPEVAVTLLTTSRPDGTGGTIGSGTYWLTELDLYGADPDASSTAATPVVRRTLVVDATMMTVMFAEASATDDGGVASVDSSNSSYAIYNNIVSLSGTCPASGAANNVPFTVQGSQLWLFPTPSNREVYTLQ